MNPEILESYAEVLPAMLSVSPANPAKIRILLETESLRQAFPVLASMMQKLSFPSAKEMILAEEKAFHDVYTRTQALYRAIPSLPQEQQIPAYQAVDAVTHPLYVSLREHTISLFPDHS